MKFGLISETNKGALTVAFSHILQAVFVVLKIKFLTNYFSIGAYAQYAILLTSMSASVALSNGGVDFLLTKKLVKGQARPEYLSAYLSRLLVVVACIVFCAAVSQAVILFFSSGEINESALLFMASISFVVVTSSNIALLAIYKGLNEISLYAKAYLFSNIANSLAQCYLVWLFRDSGVVEVLLGSAIITLIVQLILIRTVVLKYKLKFVGGISTIKFAYIKAGITIAAGKSYTAAIGMMSQVVLIYGLAQLSNDAFVAVYYLYNGLIGQVSNLVLIAVAGAFFPSLLRVFADGLSEFRQEIYTQTTTILLIIFPLLFGVIVFQQEILHLLSSKEYVLDSKLFSCMVCAAFLATAKQSFDLSLYCHKSNKYFLIAASIGSVTMIVIPSLLLYFFGIDGFGFGLILNGTVWCILLPIISSRLYQYSWATKETTWFLLTCVIFVLLSLNADLLAPAMHVLILAISGLIGFYGLFFRSRD